MRLTRHFGKGCRNRNDFSPLRSQSLKQARETQVIANGHAQAANRGINHRQLLPRLISIRLTVMAMDVIDIDIKHVNFIVTGFEFALIIK